ncbi:MAG: hypothetical protein MUC51_10745 [Anaerolineae bacterium]|nr:hypothetical protein [Anaerolineae bacterium]
MSHRRHRRQRGGPPPIFMLPVALILGLIVLVVVFGGVVSVLGGLAMTGLVCFAPLVLIGLVIAAILKDQQQKAGSSASTDAWTQPRQATKTPGATTDSAPTGAAPAFPSAERTAARPPVQPLDPSPEKGARPADEYRRRAADYRKQIQGIIKSRRSGLLADRLKDVLQKLTSWEERVNQLADRLTNYERDSIIRRDFKEVPDRINRLRRQASLETDPEMRQQIERTEAATEEQYRQLETLARTMRRTRLNLDDTLASMGTIYSQVQLLNAMDIDSGRATRIAEEIDAEVMRLNDVLSALSEAYQGAEGAQFPESLADETPAEDITAKKARLSSGSSSTS